MSCRSLKCPRSHRTPFRSASCSPSRSWRNSWWKCRRAPVTLLLSRHGCCWGPLVPGCRASGRGSTGGSRVRDTPSGPSRRGSPPAQGGIKILGKAEVWVVVDVPATMHYKFQQSSPIYSGRYLRFRSSTECCFFSCFTETGLTVQTVQMLGDSTAQFLGWLSTCPCADDRFWSDSAENCGSAVAFPDKVVDVPAVAVHRQGVDVPAIMQRRGALHTVKEPQIQFIAGV